MVEDGRIADAVVVELGRRGHKFFNLNHPNPAMKVDYAPWPNLQATGVDLQTKERLASSDPRDECGAAAHRADGISVTYQCPG